MGGTTALCCLYNDRLPFHSRRNEEQKKTEVLLCCHSVQDSLSSSWMSTNIKIKICVTMIFLLFCMGVKLDFSHEGGMQAEGVRE